MDERHTDEQQGRGDHAAPVTWAVLLGRWIEFARSAVALPNDDPGRRMRLCVADVIALQAVWFALREVDVLPESERALGLDRAALLIEKHTRSLESAWADAAMPELLRVLMADAREELEKRRAGR